MLGCSGSEDPAPRPPQYNILMVGVDTLRANHLGTYGYDKPTSPKIDAFFESAVVFEDAHSSSSWTLPSFASVMTSVYSSTHNCWQFDDALAPEFTTLAESLRDAGNQTGAVVSHMLMRPKFGLGQGFDDYDLTQAHGNLAGSHQIISSPGLTEGAIELLERYAVDPSGKPWFLFVHYFDPHWLYRPHQGLAEEFGTHLVARYDGEILFTDGYVGKLIDRLDELGLAENTIVVFVSDHGEEFEDHGRMQHGRTLYTEVERIPLAIRYPGILPKRVSEPVSGVDVMPTLLSMLGVPMPILDSPGRSLEPLLRSESIEDSGLLLESRLDQRPDADIEAFVTRKWKLIVETPREGSAMEEVAVMLFDREADPAEKVNVADQHPKIVADLQARMRAAVEEARSIALDSAGGNQLNMSEEELENLKALGYLGDLPEEDLEED